MTEPVRTCPRCGATSRVSFDRRMSYPEESKDPYYVNEYYCGHCNLMEALPYGNDAMDDLRRRWGDPVERRWTDDEFEAAFRERKALEEKLEREWAWPVEDGVTSPAERARKLAIHRREHCYALLALPHHPCRVVGFPEDPEKFAAVLANPDDDAPREEYADWLKWLYDHRTPQAAKFMRQQLDLARGLRADPTYRPAEPPSFEVFRDPTGLTPWRQPTAIHQLDQALAQRLAILLWQGLVAEPLYYRGFVEHVAMRAYRFLELADELFEAAPIRHLTLTFCKGHDHQDEGLWKALLQSPHLRRIRSLQLVARTTARELARFNRFTDRDLELLAESPHVGGLAYLSFEDAEDLTIRGFEALAASKNLGSLSYVRHDRYRYAHQVQSSWGGLGAYERTLLRNQLGSWTEQIEARHGHQVWLHPEEYYGTATPDLEAVVEHPVAKLRGQGSSG